MVRHLSKSRYTQFRCCEKALWLGVFKPEEAVITDAQQEIFRKGSEVGDLAMGLLGDFEEMTAILPDGNLDLKTMIDRTNDAIARGVANICEAAFSYKDNYCAVDILHKVNGGYEIYEVKSSTSEDKEIYGWDIAYQKYVLTGCGLNITGTFLVCIDNGYVRQGEIEIDKLFQIIDLKEAVEAEYVNVAANVKKAGNVLCGDEPEKALSSSCKSPYPCVFMEYCTKDFPKPSVLDLYGMWWKKKIEHYYAGRVSFDDVRGIKLTDIQQMQVECTLNGTAHIDKDGIRDFLDTLTYPLYHLDFESIQPAIPQYDGTRPYQQIPTQYSLHIQDRLCGKLIHKEFLAPSRGNPLRPIAEALCRDIPSDVCVLAYNRTFECARLGELADMFPDLADHLLAIKNNVRDLLIPFQSGYYYLPAMGGSFSIKSVLPALFPNEPQLDYHSLDELCQNGGDAMNLFPRLKDMVAADEAKARRALLDYCCLDTLAMVKVLEKLYEAIM